MKTFVLTLVAIAAISGVSAQTGGYTITLEDAVALTYENNPTLKALEYEALAARRERQAAIGLYMPKLNVRGAYTWLGKDIKIDLNSSKPAVAGAANNTVASLMKDPSIGAALLPVLPTIQGELNSLMGTDWAYTIQRRSTGFIGADITLPIFTGGKIITANKAARINERNIKAKSAQQRNALMSEIVERYFGYALALNAVDVRKMVVDGMLQHLHDIESLERNGMAASAERMYIEYKLSEARRELQNAKLAAQTVGAALANTIGTDAAAIPITAMFVLDDIGELEFWQTTAEYNNPLLAQVEQKRELARQNANLYRADFMPEIAAMGGASFYNYHVSGILPRWAIGVGFNFKIFDGLSREYRYSAARNTVRRVEALQVKAGEDISVLIENLYNTMLNFRNSLDSIETSIAFAEEYLRAKNAAFLEGMGTTTELIDAELNLAKVRIERMQAAYNFDLSLARLMEAAGISGQFLTYAARSDARTINYSDNKQ